jgi:hypothetical protein
MIDMDEWVIALLRLRDAAKLVVGAWEKPRRRDAPGHDITKEIAELRRTIANVEYLHKTPLVRATVRSLQARVKP